MFFNLPDADFGHGQIFVGLLATLASISVHAVIMALLSATAYHTTRAVQSLWVPIRLALVMMAAVSVLIMAHLIEIIIWAVTYAEFNVAPERADAFYFAFVNYTTLGSNDIMPVKHLRILAPMTSMNGVLLFGWSTAVIYDVLRTVAQVIPLRPNSA